MCCVEEPVQSLVLGRVELSQVESPLLTREDPTEKHDLDYGDEFDLPVYQIFDAGLKYGHLYRTTPRRKRANAPRRD